MAEYSLEITLKEKLQTRLDSNSEAELRVMPGLLGFVYMYANST